MTPPSEPDLAPKAPRVEQALDHIGEQQVEALSALAGAPASVVEFAFDLVPRGTREALVAFGLATERRDGRLAVTHLGRQAIAVARVRCPNPYEGVSLEAILASAEEAVNTLIQLTGVRIREPRTFPGRGLARVAELAQDLAR